MVPQGLYWSFAHLDLMVLRRYKGEKMVILCHNPLGPSQDLRESVREDLM